MPRSLLPLTLAAGVLVAQQVAAKATRDALFLSRFDVSALPVAMVVSALLSLAAVFAFARAMTRYSPARVVPGVLLASAVLMLGVWGLGRALPHWGAAALYLHVGVFGATLVSGFWALLAERFDPRTARQAMAPVGTGANVGAVVGGAFALLMSRRIQIPTMLPLLALLHAVCWWLLRRQPAGAGVAETQHAPSPAGLRVLGDTPYLRHLALVIALGAFAQALLDYVLGAAATARYAAGSGLMTFFAAFHTSVSVAALVVQATASRLSLERLGLAGTAAAHPAAVIVGAAAALASPRLWSAALLRGLEAVMRNSLFRSGYELFYTPLPAHKTRPTKALVDVGCDRLGTVAGSLLVLGVIAALPSPRVALVALAGASAVAMLALLPRLHAGYVSALAESLRSGAVRLDSADTLDATTRWTLAETKVALDRHALLREIETLRAAGRSATEAAPSIGAEAREAEGARAGRDPRLAAIEDLRSAEPHRQRRALSAPPDPQLVGWVLPLLAREDHFADALRYLRACAPRAVGQLVDALLDPAQDPAVRRRVARVLRGVPGPRTVEGLLHGLGDPLFEVRQQCGHALLRLSERDPGLALPRDQVFAAAMAEMEHGRGEADRGLEHVFTLLSLVLEREPVQLARRALQGQDAGLRGTALEYLENVLPESLRQRLGPLIGQGPLPAPSRPADEVRDELLRSRASWTLPRELSRER
ncbi:MAG TPA: hypothetical protein VII13_18890 [Vicinamibacteria bacterium]